MRPHRRKNSTASTLSKHETYGASRAHGHAFKPSVLARLQNWFPASRHAPTRIPSSSSKPPTLPQLFLTDKPKEPRFLKVRLVTWNMHDSLPKGNLEELLGRVEPYSHVDHNSSGTSLPQFAPDASHPYHLIVVAGQECPTQSGIPMGFGAGFKIIDKDKEKEKDRDNHENHDKPYKSRRHTSEEIHSDPYFSGWTAMLEDWFCHGGSPSNSSSEANKPDNDAQSPKKSFQVIRERKGPYQLLVKERMMGIYLAIFVHRDARFLVKGTSKSAVTAGLIGGRLGNKGGVGISVNFDGTTLLFLNAHLAAHEGRIHHRLANFAKIKTELTVDHFLAHDDPRMMAEDLTDKFDYTFLCGDLNFRLDITRLHADWLISRQEYEQALAFDQLQNIMRNGQAFVGFHEATIRFPPTFKYDVMRTLKKSKRHSKKGRAQRSLTGVEERESESESSSEEEDDEPEIISIDSSAFASSRNQEGGGSDYFQSPISRQERDAARSSSRVSLSASAAATKAKNKWRQIVNGSPGNPSTPTPRQLHRTHSSKDIGLSPVDTTLTERVSMESTKPSSKRRGSTDLVKHVSSAKSGRELLSDSEEDNDESGHGVYDSSSKRRVPSWCDRILWKTTVKPDPEPEPMGTHPRARNRTSIGQIIFGPFYRSHRGSIGSTISGDTQSSNVRSDSPEPLPQTTSNQSSLPFSRFATITPPVNITTTTPSNLRTSKSYDDAMPPRRSNSSSSLLTNRNSSRRKHTTLPPISTNVTRDNSSVRPNNTNVDNSNSGESTPLLSLPWRLFSFMTKSDKDSTAQTARADDSDILIPPAKPVHKKGEVVCLEYHTLDDRQMRRLEGRSDHRPVIGSYAIYL